MAISTLSALTAPRSVINVHAPVSRLSLTALVAEVIRAQVKGQDVAARFGGDEFAVLLPRTTASGAKALAENIRMIIQGSRIRTLTRRTPISHVTVSIGVAVWRPHMAAQRLVELADAALYQAKAGGRNRVMLPADAP